MSAAKKKSFSGPTPARFRLALHVGYPLLRVLQVVQNLAVRWLPDEGLAPNGFRGEVAERDVRRVGAGGRVDFGGPDGQARSEKQFILESGKPC